MALRVALKRLGGRSLPPPMEKILASIGFSPRFHSLLPQAPKVLMDHPGIVRTMSTSPRPPRPSAPRPEEYWFEVVGYRAPYSPKNTVYRKRVSGVHKDKAEAMFRKFMLKVKHNGQVIPNGVPSLPLYKRVALNSGKVRLVVLEGAYTLKTQYLLKFVSLELLMLSIFLYVYFGRPLSMIARVWKLLKASEGQKDPEE